ncbi:MAG: hypothetical protein KDC54_18365 [Lewinella sp.]|nr:hypothetical protein [Lewinella sp.]
MKHAFPLLWLALATTALLFSACEKEEEHGDNEVTIRILEPADNEVVADASLVHLHLEVEATDENHDIDIALYPVGDSGNKIIDQNIHDHDKLITFEQDVDLSGFPSGTAFLLEVEACTDHDCAQTEFADVTFSIQ